MYASPRLTTRRRLAEVADEWTWPCVFFFFFLVPSWKRGLETKVTYLALLLSPVKDETKKKKKKERKKHSSRRQEGKKGGEVLSSSSSSSFLLARSVWPAFVRHSGVIYHVRDAWSSPCQGNTTQPRRHRSPGECVCVWVCVCRARPIMECIIRLRCEANLSSPPLARLRMTPSFDSNFLYFTLTFSSSSLWPRLHACNLCW